MTKAASTDFHESECSWAPVFLARQPIFDTALESWGHLLLYCRTEDAAKAEFHDGMEATAGVLAHMPLVGVQCHPSERFLVHFPPQAVLDGLPRALPGGCVVIAVQEEADPGPDYINALAELKNEGYAVAVDNYQARAGAEGLAALADMVLLDTQAMNERTLEELAGKALRLCPTLLAKRVETPLVMETARQLGFSLFHGHFFRRPVVAAGRTIPSATAARLKLFDIIGKSEPDFEGLARAVEPDVAISYRLLNFLNSVHFGFCRKVTSIRQAVVLAGWKPVRNWLRIILLTDLAPSGKSRELSYLSAHRAKFLETAARRGGHPEISEVLFTLGLFSLLDALLDLSMPLIMEHLPLGEDIRSALLDGSGPLHPWLTLVTSIEDGQWETMGRIAMRLHLPPGSVANAYREAYTWCDEVFGGIGASGGGH